MRIAVIGGTGAYDPEIFKEEERKRIKTRYGMTPEISIGVLKDRKVYFLPRHGKGHAIPPHRINFKANIRALEKLGVERIVSINSVGGINEVFGPGDVVVPHDFIDFTRQRELTFYDDETVHVDVSNPYCPEVKEAIVKSADKHCDRVFSSAVYACTEGPRFETPAEIRMLKTLDCDVVGMVGIPEVVLAREAEICYASICTVTNRAAGISKKRLTTKEVKDVVKRNEENLKKIVVDTIKKIPEERRCACKDALKDARM